MEIKAHDNYQNERLELLMEAVGNSLLEGELCPNCFQRYFAQSKTARIVNERLAESIAKMKALKERSVLTIKDNSDDLIKEYICKKCQRSFLGELNLIANLSETQVLSFFGPDDTKSYKKDFYSFSLIDESYDSFVKELWEKEVDPSVQASTFTPLMMDQTTEDAISGEVLGMLKRFFEKFSQAVYSDIGSKVRVYSVYHAGTVEAGRRKGVPASGADAAIWIGPMTKEDMKAVNDYIQQVPGSELPVLVGNGVILQAKKEKGGKIDRKQIEDLMKYASIEYKGHEYLGVPGKLFMNYSVNRPYVTVLSCDYTYQLYLHSKQLPGDQQSISFPTSLKLLAEHTQPIDLPEFVQAYLSGKIGTPLLMLQYIFATPGPKLIVGLPPELLRNPSVKEQAPLSAAVDRLIEALAQRLEAVESTATMHEAVTQAFEIQHQPEPEQAQYEVEREQCYEEDERRRAQYEAALERCEQQEQQRAQSEVAREECYEQEEQQWAQYQAAREQSHEQEQRHGDCLLYTSPSPRDS